MIKALALILMFFISVNALSIPSDHGIDYDIIYVRYPANDPDGRTFIRIPQAEDAYTIVQGADLMLLKPNGTEEVIVDCTTCSVMDPFISYDGTTVYYSKILNASQNRKAPGYIYKVDLSGGAPYTEIQLTYDDGFDSGKHAGNVNVNDDAGDYTNIRDMTPIPLADGRILITSNRAGVLGFEGMGFEKEFAQQFYVLDDHDGTKNTDELSNLHRIEQSNMQMAQHPIQLKDGRILFSTWQNFGEKPLYAMTELFTMYPDGSNLQQFTEPHDHAKVVNHFITQIASGDIVSGWYYNSYDYGYGTLNLYPINVSNGEYLRGSVTQVRPWDPAINFSKREFDIPGTRVITSHTTEGDSPAPGQSGKYAMPSWAKNGHLLTAYSTGYVNHFDPACNKTTYMCENLKSGIYLIKNIQTVEVTDPTDTAQMVQLLDSASYNEIWPRAVVPYNDVFGQSAPTIIPSVRETESHPRLAKGEVAAIIGTSSTLNRETKVEPDNPDGDHKPNSVRELTNGNFTIHGTEVGIFNDSDVYGIRILAIPEKVYTSKQSVSTTKPFTLKGFDHDTTVERYASAHDESWEILGEFPFTHKSVTDPQGNPDTSWMAKIPAETPTTIQAIDINGMTLYSETVWRSMAPGEERTDCAGCHAHSVDMETLAFNLSEAGKGAAISGVAGVSDDDPRIKYGMWDLTGDQTPLIADGGGIEWMPGRTIDIEYVRDIEPIITANCTSCHTSGGSGSALILDETGGAQHAWAEIIGRGDYNYNNTNPQESKYIRSPQARNSLFVWVAWDQRLDGRTSSSRSNDVDFPSSHPVMNLSFSDKRKIARWVDLGMPINIPTGEQTFLYTDDNQLPYIEIFSPKRGSAVVNQKIRFGVMDAQSDIDWPTLAVTYYDVSTPGTVLSITNLTRDTKGIVTAPMPSLTVSNDYVLKITVDDAQGNTQEAFSRFTATASATLPSQVSNVGVTVTP